MPFGIFFVGLRHAPESRLWRGFARSTPSKRACRSPSSECGPVMKVSQTSALPLGYGDFCTTWYILSLFWAFLPFFHQKETNWKPVWFYFLLNYIAFFDICKRGLEEVWGLFANRFFHNFLLLPKRFEDFVTQPFVKEKHPLFAALISKT